MAKLTSSLSTDSIRQVAMLCANFAERKIKSVYTLDFIKSFREKFAVKENLQIILFGQMIPEDGFKEEDKNPDPEAGKGQRLKSLRT